MTEFVFLFLLSLQQKQSLAPAESVEHKFLVAQSDETRRLNLKASHDYAVCSEKANDGVSKGYTLTGCEIQYDPILQALTILADLIDSQLEHVDACTKTYRTTIDKKASELTVRETTSMKACQALRLYPLDMSAQPQK